MMRQPARLAGLAVLHDFLERGFEAFHQMHGAEYFLATIDARERALFDRIFTGEEAPFEDRWWRRGAAPVETLGGDSRLRLVEALVELPVHFALDRRLDRSQQQSQLAVEPDLVLQDVQFTGEAGRWNSMRSPCHV